MPKPRTADRELYRPRFHHHFEWMAYFLVSRCRLRLRQIESRYL